MKRLLSTALAVVLTLSMAVSVLAHDGDRQAEFNINEVSDVMEQDDSEAIRQDDSEVVDTTNPEINNDTLEDTDQTFEDVGQGVSSNSSLSTVQLPDVNAIQPAEASAHLPSNQEDDKMNMDEESPMSFDEELLPTADELLYGYINTTGISAASQVNIESIEMVETPISHLKVSASVGPQGTTGSFNLHLPPKELWEGRFFQLVHPNFIDKNVTDHNIGFSFDSGAYTLQTSPGPIIPVKTGLDMDAAAAHISKTIAKNYYNYDEHIYGYIYGGSGGSMQTIGAMEAGGSLEGIWDGAVPYISASPVSLGNFNIRLFARVVLEDKAPLIADALSPGGSGDPYAELSEMEAEVLSEVTKLGLPLAAWHNYEYLLLIHNHATLEEAIAEAGTTDTNGYNVNFWTQDGFLGTEDSELGELFRNLRDSGVDADGLATVAYHRHIDPGTNYRTWDHLKDASGNPLYAQIGGLHSGMSIATMMSGNAAYDGSIKMKVIMVQNLMDVDSFPTDGHWYRERVREQGLEGNFRIWLNQHADHLDEITNNMIDYSGSLEQALRDLAAWVEDGIEPPLSTSYTVNEDNQLIVAKEATARSGIQPVVDLVVNGGDRVDIFAGATVNFEVTMQAPPNTGSIVSIEWDYNGDRNFVEGDFTTLPDGTAVASGSATYTDVGTYFPQVRVVSQREGDSDTAFARIENFGRARVVVSPFVPVLTINRLGDDTATVGKSYEKNISISYTGNDTLTFKATGLPNGVTINEATGVISGTPTATGSSTIILSVAEAIGSLEAEATYTLTVQAAVTSGGDGGKDNSGDGSSNTDSSSTKLTLSGLPSEVRVGATFTLTPSVNDRKGSDGWKWDETFFSATFNSPATFTALKEGTTSIVYTSAGGSETAVTITIQAASDSSGSGSGGDSTIVITGDGASTSLWAILSLVLVGATAALLIIRKRRKSF